MARSTFLSGLALVMALAAPVAITSRAFADPKAAPGPVTLDGLMTRFRAMPGLFARYHEEKRIALLARPLVSDGTLHFAPGPPRARLARHTLTPSPASVVLDGNALRFGDGNSEESIDLGASPVVRAFVTSFLQLLAGDRAALEKTFTIELKVGEADKPDKSEKWQLTLRPKLEALTGILKELSFAGDGVTVSRMRIVEATGDESVTTFTDVDPRRRYGAEEAAQVFRIRPPAP